MNLVLQNLEHDLEQIETAREKIQYIISRHIQLYTQNPAEAKTLLYENTACRESTARKSIEKSENIFLNGVDGF